MRGTLVLATGNQHKAEEIRSLLADLPLRILTLKDFPDFSGVIEDGETCQANAMKKARETALYCRQWTLADDTGLEVEALGGKPGVYAARYAGENASYEDNCRKLLEKMKVVPIAKRAARFVTVMALSDLRGNTEVVEGMLEGTITEKFYGNRGFGYDPIFYVPEAGKTLAEMTLQEKNQISHRARALAKAKELLTRRLMTNR
ncbi:MAG: XTP/dITP diphosphatase [Nitrospirales bacterium]|nr:XTP/dITP diphosphatase [Nitrospirales bacterium]